MKHHSLLSTAVSFMVLLAATTYSAKVYAQKSSAKQFYELLIYHLKDKSQEERVDKYLSEAFLPAAHRHGVKTVGVFKISGIDTAADKRMYVLLTYKSLSRFHSCAIHISAHPWRC